MKVQIDIECDDIRELKLHLSVLQLQVNHERKRLELDTADDFSTSLKITDNNCYGYHELKVLEDE